MNLKELNEIRRRIRPGRSSITHVYGCYVNGAKEIISSIDESLGILSEEEQEKYLSLLKKSLSGTLGKTLLNLSFATKQVVDSEEHRLLSALRKTELKDPVLRDEFYKCIINSLSLEDDNYLILMAFDSYDVPRRSKDGRNEDSGEVFKYILCAVCPVKSGKAQLGYDAEEKRFHTASIGQAVAAPELGFMFPAFDDRAANIYGALFYSKSTDEIHQDFIDAVFRTEAPMSAGRQREAFGSILAESAEGRLGYELVRSVHEQLSEKIALHKESKDPEPLSISAAEMGDILENGGFSPEQTDSFCKNLERDFGPNAELSPANIIDSKKLEIVTPEIKLSIDPKLSYLVHTQVVDGRKYILVPADTGVEINGISVEV